MLRKAQLLALAMLLYISPSFGHPVSFKGGYSFMAFNQADMLDWQLLYTFHPKLAVGVDFFRDTMEPRERYFLIPRMSWLVQRWNELDSQANIYVYGGAGLARKADVSAPAVEAGVEVDYETRKIYLSAKATTVAARGFDTLSIYQFRTGFAPYVGEANDLHAWLIAQVQYLPFANQESLRVGPVLRMFHKNVLWELGMTARGSWNFNFMVHW